MIQWTKLRSNNKWVLNETSMFIAHPFGAGSTLTRRAPVVLFSHGNSFYGEFYRRLFTKLASHGVVVLAPDFLVWTIGNQANFVKYSQLLDARKFIIEQERNASSPFYQRVDVDAFIVAGHSWGGGIATYFARTNPG